MAFTMSLDDFIITHFTRGAGMDTLSTLIYSQVRRGIQPTMYALSTLIFVAVLVLLVITNFAPEKKSTGNATMIDTETIKRRKRNNQIKNGVSGTCLHADSACRWCQHLTAATPRLIQTNCTSTMQANILIRT